MELKPGYKQTEVGVIPEDWIFESISNLVDINSPICYGVVQVGRHSHDGVPIVAIKNVKEIGKAAHHLASRGIEAPYARSRVRPGDVLISIKGTIGRVGIVPNGFIGNISRELARLRIKDGICADFVAFQLEGLSTQDRISKAIVGTTRLEFSIGHLRNFQVALPLEENEQRAIADMLSDVDATTMALEALIAKKQGLKQAAMQELLTGKRRLPGFEGEWEVKRLGSEIRHLQAGVSVTSTTDNDQANTDHYVLKTSAVFQGRFMPAEKKQISPGEVKRAKTSIRKGDLIISRMNTPALVGECGYSDSDYPNLFLPDRLWRADCRDPRAVSSRWLTYALSMQQNRLRIKDLATGTSGSMKNISKYSLLDLEIEWPSFTEQIVLATVLSEMDNEIDLINEQLQKANSIKQGMMQQLLTGKIRLK